jgi:hypothetical protein
MGGRRTKVRMQVGNLVCFVLMPAALPADWSSGGSLDVLSLQSGAFDPLGDLLRLTAALGRTELAELLHKFRL